MNLFRFGANLRLIPETSKLFLYFRILEDKITVLVLFGASLMTGVCHHLSLRRVLIDDRLFEPNASFFPTFFREDIIGGCGIMIYAGFQIRRNSKPLSKTLFTLHQHSISVLYTKNYDREE